MSREDVFALPSIRVTINPGGVAQIGSVAGQIATTIKLISGGTLEIGGFVGAGGMSAPLSLQGLTMVVGAAGASQFATGQTFGQMYPISANEVFSANASGAVYLYASGATCVVAIGLGRSAGFEGV